MCCACPGRADGRHPSCSQSCLRLEVGTAPAGGRLCCKVSSRTWGQAVRSVKPCKVEPMGALLEALSHVLPPLPGKETCRVCLSLRQFQSRCRTESNALVQS